MSTITRRLRRGSTGSEVKTLQSTLNQKVPIAKLPNRVKLNVDSGYAKFYKKPASSSALEKIIDEAWSARINNHCLIENPRERFKYNKSCE